MTVYELNQNQLDELKTRVFYLNESDSMYESLMESLDNEIEIELEKAQWITDISNETIYKLFSGYDFVEEDFAVEQKYYDVAIYNYNGEIIYTMEVEASSLEEAKEIIWDNFIQVAYADER